MKTLGRVIRRLVIAGVVGGGALFAAIKVGPRVAPKIRALLHRAPESEATPDFPDDAAEPAPTETRELPADQPGATSAGAVENPEVASHNDASE